MVIRLQSSWTFEKNKHGIEVLSPMKRKRYQINGNSEILEEIMIRLELGIHKEEFTEIANNIGVDVEFLESTLELLEKYNMTIKRETNLFCEYDYLYDRQIRFFDLFEDQINSGESLNHQLQNSTVLIIGVGGYGSWIALMCGRIGIKNIIAIDCDTVESSNLNRQILFNKDDIGKLKVEVAKREIESVDPSINFEAINLLIKEPADLKPFLERVDFVFNAFGYYPLKIFELIWKECLNNDVPSIVFGGSWVGPLNVPGQTPCINCLTLEEDINQMIGASQVRYYNSKNELPVPSLAPRMAFTTSLAVWEAIRFLSGIDRPKTLDGILMFDLFNYHNVPFRNIAIKENCPSCQKEHKVLKVN